MLIAIFSGLTSGLLRLLLTCVRSTLNDEPQLCPYCTQPFSGKETYSFIVNCCIVTSCILLVVIVHDAYTGRGALTLAYIQFICFPLFS